MTTTTTDTIDHNPQTIQKSVIVKVNNHDVTFSEHRVTGAEIKATAIAQGVPIQSDFALFEVKGQGKLKPVGDNDTVTLNPNDEFRAIAPDDNS